MIQTLITNYFNYSDKKINSSDKNKMKENNIIRGYNIETCSWHCIECGVDMGKSNPRQYCKKTFCENAF